MPHSGGAGPNAAGARGEQHCITRDSRRGAREPATAVLPHQVARVPVQRDGAAIPCREINMLLYDRWRRQKRLRGAIRPGDLVRERRRVRGEATTVRGASDLRPGMGGDAGADAGRGAGWTGTEIKKTPKAQTVAPPRRARATVRSSRRRRNAPRRR